MQLKLCTLKVVRSNGSAVDVRRAVTATRTSAGATCMRSPQESVQTVQTHYRMSARISRAKYREAAGVR